ncbi:MAG: hypothetical protein E6Q37_03825 [Crocinitomicaceae bacterium]|nr:MAG: hypothetical protein E6Q37_03825 [Crocinitomicaceae bacterium]
MDGWEDFEIIENLGSRNHRKFNEVKHVRNRKTGTDGVLKRCVKTKQNQHLIPLIRQEAGLNFDSPCLPHTLAFEETETEIWMIRNFQKGIGLDRFWAQLPKKQRSRVCIQLLEKLIPLFEEIQEKAIVHADVKPSNLIIDANGKDFDVKLIDFGISIDLKKSVDRSTLFALGFSAPELILNKIHLVNHTTDLFALGTTLWFLCTGKLPLSHPNPGIMTNLQITHPLPINKQIPAELKAVLPKMCFKHSFHLPPNLLPATEVDAYLSNAMQQRFQSITEILEVIHEVQQRENKRIFYQLFRKRTT